MKTLKYISFLFLLLALVGCSKEEFGDTDFLSSAQAPSDISALFNITQDNTGMVTITPNSTGGVKYIIDFGDGTAETVELKSGESIKHIYAEDQYNVKVTAIGITGLKSEASIPLTVSFKAPENLEVVITNDEAVSKKVNVTANADFATMFEVYFGEEGNDEPVMANIGDVASYVYKNPGTYTIRVVVKGGAKETTEYTEEFTVTAIIQPTSSAPAPPARNEADYIAVYSNEYAVADGYNYNPDWGQSGQGSGFAEFDLNGDQMLQYIKLSYQGIQFPVAVDASQMEFIHMDVWTADVDTLETSLISLSTGEKPVKTALTADSWTSIDIPISAFTDQGLGVADIHQIKLVGIPWAGGTVFVDNIYFYKSPSGGKMTVQDFEGDIPGIIVFGGITDPEIVDNPDKSGINTSDKVVKQVKTAGSEVWAGSLFEVNPALNLKDFQKISVKTWSPKVGAVVKLKLENADGSITHEVDVATTVANEWEELVYDFSSAPEAEYVKVVIFFDFGNPGDDSVYYYDDFTLVQCVSAEPLTFQNFEEDNPGFTVFGNIADIEIIDNPDVSDGNNSGKVAKMVKTAGSEVWAGMFFGTNPLDLNTYDKISVKIWSPKKDIVVKLKLENDDASIVHEVDMNATSENAWHTLTYDFKDAPAADYNRVVLFFDFGNAGDDSVYYFDEFTLTK